MPHMQPMGQFFQGLPQPDASSGDALEQVPDDHPHADMLTERYPAWSATSAIYGFVPFQAPARR